MNMQCALTCAVRTHLNLIDLSSLFCGVGWTALTGPKIGAKLSSHDLGVWSWFRTMTLAVSGSCVVFARN